MKPKPSITAAVLQLFARVVATLQAFVFPPAYVALPVREDPLQDRRSALLHIAYRRRTP